MPLYSYTCEACEGQEEHLEKVSDPPATVCSRCGKSSLKRVVAPVAFHLKGGGWYKDGYGSTRKDGGGSGGQETGGSSGGSGTSGSSSGGSKSEAASA